MTEGSAYAKRILVRARPDSQARYREVPDQSRDQASGEDISDEIRDAVPDLPASTVEATPRHP